MPWQRLVADVGGELLADGTPAYRQVVVTVPRQSGKSTLILAWMVQRCVGWDGPQRVIYSAQTGNDARKKLVEDWMPSLEAARRGVGISRLLRGMGNEAIEFRSGSRIVLLAGTEKSGHGKTVDLAIKDELFADYDDRRDQALIPAMATKRKGQMVTASTAGTADSVALNRLVERGRASVEAGKTTGIAYFEWSAPDDADIDDPDVWWSCMPALGHTITVDVVEDARRAMSEAEFRRAFLNIPTLRAEGRLVPESVWRAVCGDHAPEGRPTMAVDVNPERSATSVVACDGRTVELVEHREGTGWAVGFCRGVDEAQGGLRWVVDQSGPAASLATDLEREGLTVVRAARREFVEWCGGFFDALVDRRVRVREHPRLDAAAGAVGKRSVGDAWMWSRKGIDDIAPLVAATLAWGASQGPALTTTFVAY